MAAKNKKRKKKAIEQAVLEAAIADLADKKQLTIDLATEALEAMNKESKRTFLTKFAPQTKGTKRGGPVAPEPTPKSSKTEDDGWDTDISTSSLFADLK